MMYELIHVHGCGGPALRLDHMPSSGEIVFEGATNLDGTKPDRSEVIACGTCGKPLGGLNFNLDYIRQVADAEEGVK